MAKIKFEANLKGLEKQIKNLKKLPMLKTGLKALELNEEQLSRYKTKSGIERLKPYSEQYAKRKDVGVDDVDLTSTAKVNKNRTGHMLQNFGVVRTTANRVLVGFSSLNERLKAKWITTGGKNPSKARPFVGLQRKNRKKLRDFFSKLISKGVY